MNDLIQPVALAAQRDHALSGRVLLGLALGPGARLDEQLGEVRLAVVGDERLCTLALL